MLRYLRFTLMHLTKKLSGFPCKLGQEGTRCLCHIAPAAAAACRAASAIYREFLSAVFFMIFYQLSAAFRFSSSVPVV